MHEYNITHAKSKKNAKLFVNSPNAIPGNTVDKCDTSSAKFQSEKTGLVDGVGTEEEILSEIRTLVSILPCNNEEDASYTECSDDLNRACSEIENATEDTAIALAEIADDHVFFETQKNHAKDMVTGFIRLNGMTVGAVANRSKVYDENAEVVEEFDGALSARGARKAARFVEFCDAFNIPVLTLTNVSGFAATMCAERSLAKAAAKLTYAFANATVPKVNVVIGKAFGSAYVTMNSKSLGADMVYAWPTAEIAVMGGAGAVEVLYAREAKEQENPAQFLAEKEAEYTKLFANPYNAAKYGYIDDVIEPRNTRFRVIRALQQLQTKKLSNPAKKHGNIPL